MVVGYETKINRTKINQTKYNQTKINRGRNPTNCSIRSRDNKGCWIKTNGWWRCVGSAPFDLFILV